MAQSLTASTTVTLRPCLSPCGSAPRVGPRIPVPRRAFETCVYKTALAAQDSGVPGLRKIVVFVISPAPPHAVCRSPHPAETELWSRVLSPGYMQVIAPAHAGATYFREICFLFLDRC